jgi:hypothetical protein
MHCQYYSLWRCPGNTDLVRLAAAPPTIDPCRLRGILRVRCVRRWQVARVRQQRLDALQLFLVAPSANSPAATAGSDAMLSRA